MAPILFMDSDCGKCLDNLLVEYCSPTLAGVKIANMFSAFVNDRHCVDRYLEYGNSRLNRKGVFLRCLRFRNGKALLLVYRRSLLGRRLEKPEVKTFLADYGYGSDVEADLEILTERMADQDFPHEIGVFLGYPLGDVVGFIDNKGQNSLFGKYWKVYSNAEETGSLFLKMDRICEKYKRSYFSGNSIDRLTVNVKGA